MAKKPLEVGDILPPKQLLEFDHLYNRDNSTYCVRPSCEGCQFDDRCQKEETFIKIGPGINIRQAFRARPGYKWACIDFAGIELRVAAQESGESVWVKAFQEDRDLHEAMGRVMFKTDDVTKAQRDIAKMGNFGNLYLASVGTFHALTDLTFQEAAVAWKKWWAAVPGYAAWVEKQKLFYRKNGYVKTFFGRKREMRDIIAKAKESEGGGGKKGKKIGWGFCDRTSCNSVIQGASADLLKMSMFNVDTWIRNQKLTDDIKMMISVHDELDFEIRDTSDIYHQLRDIGRQMTLTPEGEDLPRIKGWNIPLKVDIEIGDDWGNLANIDDLDPSTKDKPKVVKREIIQRDHVILQVSSLVQTEVAALHLAIYQAANVDGVVKVPLRMKMGDREYTLKTMERVSEGHLRKAIQGIQGVSLV